MASESDPSCPAPMVFSDLPPDIPAETAYPREVPPNVLAWGVGWIKGKGSTCIGAKITADWMVFSADCYLIVDNDPAKSDHAIVLNGAASGNWLSEEAILNEDSNLGFRFAPIPWGRSRPVAWTGRKAFPNEPATILRIENDTIRYAHSSLPPVLFSVQKKCGCPDSAHVGQLGSASSTAKVLAFGSDAHLIAVCNLDACNALSHCSSLDEPASPFLQSMKAIQPLLFGDLSQHWRADAVAVKRDGIYARVASFESFEAPSKYSESSPEANAFALGDVTGDQQADLLAIGPGIDLYRSKADAFENPVRVDEATTGARMARVAHVIPEGTGQLVLMQSSRLLVVRGLSTTPSTETWFNKLPEGITNFDVRDVTGDGLADAILGFADHVAVLRSTGTAFEAPENWLTGVNTTAPGWFFADVNTDYRADAIRVDISGSQVYLSTGSAFQATSEPWNEVPIGERGNYFADVNADGAADAIIQNQDNILIYQSTNMNFIKSGLWSKEAYYGGAL